MPYPTPETVEELTTKIVERRTGFHPSVVAGLYEEFLSDEGANDKDFIEYAAEVVANGCFILAATSGADYGVCTQAGAIGYETVAEDTVTLDREEVGDVVTAVEEAASR